MVLHPSAFPDWVGKNDPSSLRLEFEDGRLEVVVPRSFGIDVLAVFVARGWSANRIERAAAAVSQLGFTLADAPTSELIAWLVRGLPAAAAGYAALASWLDTPIAVTDPDVKRATPDAPAGLAYICIYDHR